MYMSKLTAEESKIQIEELKLEQEKERTKQAVEKTKVTEMEHEKWHKRMEGKF